MIESAETLTPNTREKVEMFVGKKYFEPCTFTIS